MATGAIGGTLIGSGIGAGAGIAAFAAIGAGGGLLASQAGYSIASGKKYNSNEMLVASAVGAGSGAISGALGAPASVNPLAGSSTSVALQGLSNFAAGSAQYVGTQLVNRNAINPEDAAIAGGMGFVSGGIADGISLGGSATGHLVDLYGVKFATKYAKIPLAKAIMLDALSEGVVSLTVNTVTNGNPHVRSFVKSFPEYVKMGGEFIKRTISIPR